MNYWSHFVGRFGLVILLGGLAVLFSALRPETFGTPQNFASILYLQSVPVVLALAVLLPLVSGQFDLSVASNLGLAQIVVVGGISEAHLGVVPAIVLAILVSAAIGLVNGLVVTVLKVGSFIATLATGSLVLGLQLWLTGGGTLFNPLPREFTDLGRGSIPGVPFVVIYAVVFCLLTWFFLNHTVGGRRMYAIGGSERAARLIGIDTARYTVSVFTIGGALCGVAGVMLGAQLGTAQPGGGSSLLIPAFTGALLSPATIQVGRLNVWGAVVGILVIAVAVSGLQQLGAPVWVQPAFNGAALIVAVALSGWALRLRESRAIATKSREVGSSDTAGIPGR